MENSQLQFHMQMAYGGGAGGFAMEKRNKMKRWLAVGGKCISPLAWSWVVGGGGWAVCFF